MRRLVVLAVPLVLLLATAPAAAVQAEPHAAPQTSLPEAADILAHLPLTFVAGDGEIPYRTTWGPAAVGFSREGLTTALTDTSGTTERWAFKMAFRGARAVRPRATERAPGVISYFTGSPDQWRTGLSTYRTLAYRELWPGIDLTYTGDRSSLKYAFRVQPGADPGRIGMRWRGATVTRAEDGGLLIATPAGSLYDGAPVAWQPGPAGRSPVAAAWRAESDGSWGFGLGAFDPSRPLVVDPEILFSGFLGGSSNESGYGVTVDPAGALYVTGDAGDNGAGATDFPTTVGPDTSFNGYYDVFVAKVAPGSAGLVYSGFIGGTEYDYRGGIAVDGSGAAYVTGTTYSSQADGFPVLGGPDLTFNGSGDAFITKVKPDGTGLVYSGYIGGTDYESDTDVAIDAGGSAYVTGATRSTQGDGFPVLGGPDVTYNGGGADVFVSKVQPSGSGLEYSGYIGGSYGEEAADVAVDGSGAAYVGGHTDSSQTDGFPVSGGPDLTFNGDQDAFVAKVEPNGSALDYAGYIGGSDGENFGAIAVDAPGAVYVIGDTRSDQTVEGFPAAVGPDLSYAGPTGVGSGDRDAFIAKVNPGGAGLVYAGYIGGTDYENGNDVAVDAAGNAYVAGETGSTTSDGFPAVEGPDKSFNGGDDGFVGRVLPSGAGLGFLSYYGGLKYDYLYGIAVDAAGRIFVTGETNTGQADGFPVKKAFDVTHNGEDDVILASLAEVCGGRVATIVGTPGNEKLAGTNGADVIVALGGKDKVFGRGGADRICGDAGNDTLKGGGGKDKLNGEEGKDVLLGQAGKDVCVGGPQKDRARDCEKERQV